jgi:hypothetical protein
MFTSLAMPMHESYCRVELNYEFIATQIGHIYAQMLFDAYGD